MQNRCSALGASKPFESGVRDVEQYFTPAIQVGGR